MQFGDDWPGVFIRGDNACTDAMALTYLRDKLNSFSEHPDAGLSLTILDIIVLENLIKTLGGCDLSGMVSPTATPAQKLRAYAECLKTDETT